MFFFDGKDLDMAPAFLFPNELHCVVLFCMCLIAFVLGIPGLLCCWLLVGQQEGIPIA